MPDQPQIAVGLDGQTFIRAPKLSARELVRVDCPKCGAAAGEVCRTGSDHRPTGWHRARYRRAGLTR